LLVLGPLLAVFAAPLAGACLAGVALTAALYDLVGRGAWLGPTLLGLCRAGNLAAGVCAGFTLHGVEGPPLWTIGACVAYGLYVFFASRLARLEDDEDTAAIGARPTRALLGASSCLAIAPWLVTLLYFHLPYRTSQVWGCWNCMIAVHHEPRRSLLMAWWIGPAAVLAGISAAWLMREALRNEPWSRARVGRTAGMALRRLLVFTAVLSWCAPMSRFPEWELRPATSAGMILAPLILLGYPIALRLRRVFPPT
jgi:hypothetical protein